MRSIHRDRHESTSGVSYHQLELTDNVITIAAMDYFYRNEWRYVFVTENQHSSFLVL
jgi:hypothetical protein